MSLTTLVPSASTHSVILSPSKRRSADQEPFEATRTSDLKPTHNQLWKWCLRADAVAQCYIRDVIQLKENSHETGKEPDAFWWLGSVPCRSVKFVGMLVGAKAYEKRTIYTIDDGTGVIQCMYTHFQSKDKPKSRQQTKPVSSVQDQLVPVSEWPTPRYEVGDILRVSGRVETWNNIRQIVIYDIQLCWANDEPEHWLATAKLHKTFYSQPFVIPPLPPPQVPQTPVKPSTDAPTFATPNTVSTVTTPSTAATPSSDRDTLEDGPPRLRHPSRLRSKELVASTFKIYLKNYMDILSDPSRQAHVNYLQFNRDGYSIRDSPLKRIKHNIDDESATPRPKNKQSPFLWELDTTPRPSNWNANKNMKMPIHQTKGFTLSYLRRVPELAEMAHRVVEHERKRRAREERQKQKEALRTGREDILPIPKQSVLEPSTKKVKRLFIWTIRELHKEGSIILHEDDAPVWEFPVLANASVGIWTASRSDHSSTSLNTVDTSSSTMNYSLALSAVDENKSQLDAGELSDPPAREESYIPLTPVMLMEPIVDAIKSFLRRRPRQKHSSSVQQSNGTHLGRHSKVVGPTIEELKMYLSSADARWENVGEYTISDALDMLKKEGKVYGIGSGRWELTI